MIEEICEWILIAAVVLFIAWLTLSAGHAECFTDWREAHAAHPDAGRPKYDHHLKNHQGEKCWYAPGWRDKWNDTETALTPTRTIPATASARGSAALAVAKKVVSRRGETGASLAMSSVSTGSADASLPNSNGMVSPPQTTPTINPLRAEEALPDRAASTDIVPNPVAAAHDAFSEPPSEFFALALWLHWLRASDERIRVQVAIFQNTRTVPR